VPVPVDRAWDALLDPQRIAPCMPGASLESWKAVPSPAMSRSSSVRSTCPIAAGPATSQEHRHPHDRHRRHRQGSQGKRRRQCHRHRRAHPRRRQHDRGDDHRLDVTGRPAQFGRGVMNDVANKLVGQFAANLDALLTSGDREAATPGHPTPAASTPTPGASGAIGQLPQAATPAAGDELDVFALLGLSPVARRRWPPRSSSPTCSCWAGLSAGSATAASLTAEGHPKTRTVNPATGGSSRPTTPRISMRSLACSPPCTRRSPGGRPAVVAVFRRNHRRRGAIVCQEDWSLDTGLPSGGASSPLSAAG
jgi:uncharacterized protein